MSDEGAGNFYRAPVTRHPGAVAGTQNHCELLQRAAQCTQVELFRFLHEAQGLPVGT